MENEYIYSEEFQAYGDKLKNSLSEYVTLESTLLDADAIKGEGESTPQKCMQEFLDASLTGDKDTAIKKLFAAGIALANDSGVLPFELPDSSSEGIATFVDGGLTQIKVAYKVATGEIPAEEVVDTLIDHAAARAMTYADSMVDRVEANTDLICDALSVVFPPAATAIQLSKPFVKKAASWVAPKAKELIHTGISKVSQVAKEAARPLIAKAREIGAKVKNRLLNAIFG